MKMIRLKILQYLQLVAILKTLPHSKRGKITYQGQVLMKQNRGMKIINKTGLKTRL